MKEKIYFMINLIKLIKFQNKMSLKHFSIKSQNYHIKIAKDGVLGSAEDILTQKM